MRTVLREEVRLALERTRRMTLNALILKLDQLAAAARDPKVESIYESPPRGCRHGRNGDYANAIDELDSDFTAPLVVQQLIAAATKNSTTPKPQKKPNSASNTCAPPQPNGSP